ncbi:MAG TPA: Hsp70 family protein, partial [Rudaea sp.]|nr:Hsp70 family protein [Rudaea sp.]
LVNTRNKADQLVHATRAAIKEHGGKVPGQIGAIEAALSDLEKVMKGEDKEAIDSKIAALEAAAQSLGAAAAAGSGGGGAGSEGPQTGGSSAPKDDVVDAEFTEVKDKK